MADIERSKDIGIDESDADSSDESSSSSSSSSGGNNGSGSDRSNSRKKKTGGDNDDNESNFGAALGLPTSMKSNARSGGVTFSMAAPTRDRDSDNSETDSD